MAIEHARGPQREIGSKEWVKTLSPKATEDGRTVTSLIESRAREVLGEDFPDAAWEKMFTRSATESMYTQRRGHSLAAGAVITISQKLDWGTDDPEFAYTSAQMVTNLAEDLSAPKDHGDLVVTKLVDGKRVIVPQTPPEQISVETLHEKLSAYAEKEGIEEEKRRELEYIAAAPLLKESKKSRALQILQKRGKDGLIDYLTPLKS
jgi:hypothetical protein